MKNQYLIVDADDDTVSLIEKTVKRSRPLAEFDVFSTADKVLKAIQEQEYDMGFIDPSMPGFTPAKISAFALAKR